MKLKETTFQTEEDIYKGYFVQNLQKQRAVQATTWRTSLWRNYFNMWLLDFSWPAKKDHDILCRYDVMTVMVHNNIEGVARSQFLENCCKNCVCFVGLCELNNNIVPYLKVPAYLWKLHSSFSGRLGSLSPETLPPDYAVCIGLCHRLGFLLLWWTFLARFWYRLSMLFLVCLFFFSPLAFLLR